MPQSSSGKKTIHNRVRGLAGRRSRRNREELHFHISSPLLCETRYQPTKGGAGQTIPRIEFKVDNGAHLDISCQVSSVQAHLIPLETTTV